MSSHSYSDTCPNCGNSADCCDDTKAGRSIWCPHCGLTEYPIIRQMDLETLNSYRQSMLESGDLPEVTELSKLPEWTLDQPPELWIVLYHSTKSNSAWPVFSSSGKPSLEKQAKALEDFDQELEYLELFGPFKIDV